MEASGVVTALAVYPVKGLSPEPLTEVQLQPGRGFPRDRTWALARADGAYRLGTRDPVPKEQFHMLVRDERLAGLNTRLDGESRLRVRVRDHVVLDAALDTDDGREATRRFFARILDLPPESAPVIAREPERRFTDVSVVSDALMHAVSFINLASIRALEEKIDMAIDPYRFRANVYYDGLPPFSELRLVGSPITVGTVGLEGVLTTRRCAATEVNPTDAKRDLPVPRLIAEHFGHTDMGVYGIVGAGGTIAVGDTITHSAEAGDGRA